MDNPLTMDPRYRRAAYRCMWFGAAFALVCAALAALSWAGLMGEPKDASMLVLMAVGGIVLFVSTRIGIRFFRV